MNTMIEALDVWKRHGSLEVLKGVHLQVARGEVAAIIGPSGSGKSTFLRCLNGLERFDRGTVHLGGLALAGGDRGAHRGTVLRQLRRRVGMVFQSFNLFAHLNVLENVIEAPMHVLGRPEEEARAQARALLDRVGLGSKLEAMPRQLSGGQQQRVAIARALAMNPEAILFDEPTSALDPKMTGEVLAVMTDLARDGLTMIVVTHAMRFARQVAHTVHVFEGGVVVESGPPAQIFENPSQEATRQLVSQAMAA